jgi:hypothetical protein
MSYVLKSDTCVEVFSHVLLDVCSDSLNEMKKELDMRLCVHMCEYIVNQWSISGTSFNDIFENLFLLRLSDFFLSECEFYYCTLYDDKNIQLL